MNTVEIWHEIVRERDPERLDEILAEDCIFYSPVVHSPQRGRELTKFYLTGAMHVFNDSFRYVREVVTEDCAVLEFECDLDGIQLNAVDIMSFDAEGRISQFKVMVRPLQAVNALHVRMKSMLEKLA